MRRRARILIAVVAAAAAVTVPARAAAPGARITKLTPTSGPVGSVVHVEGNGCAGNGTFEVSNGNGEQFDFTSAPDGTFAFDYKVPPAEAGDQTENSMYDTSLFCAATNRTAKGPKFEITGPVFTLKPPSAPVGASVRVVGQGCVQDGAGPDDGVLLVDGKQLRTFKAEGDFSFDFTFVVPELTVDRKYVVQINCLIQRLESAAGDGGQRFISPGLLLVTSGAVATTPTTTSRPVRRAKPSSSKPWGLLLSAIAAAVAVTALVVTVRRRQAHRRLLEASPEFQAERAAREAEEREARQAADEAREVAARKAAEVAAAEEAARAAEEQAAREGAAEEAARAAAEQAAREAEEREAAEQAAREAAEEAARAAEQQAAREAEEREAAERAAAEQAAREAAEEAARAAEQQAAREAEEREAAEQAAREAEERAAAEEAARAAAEQAAREAEEREAAERAAREAAEEAARAAEQQAAREAEEREAAEQAAREAAEEAARAAEQQAAREAEEREAAERAAREAEEEAAREAAEQAEQAEREAEERETAAAAQQAAAGPPRRRRRQPLKARRFAAVRQKNGDVAYPEPPYVEQRPFELTAFGDVRADPYYWLRERDNPDVIAYLEAENAYAETVLEPLGELRQRLFDTIKGRTKEDDTSPPVPLRGFEYYSRTAEGAQYPDSCRRPRGGSDGDETVILDRNAMAEGHDYLSCIGPHISPNDGLCLYATDFDGSEKYTIRVRDLATLDDLEDVIPGTAGDMCWVTDDVFLYVMLDDAHRPYQVRRHVIGDDASHDPVIYEDNDERFFVRVVRDIAGRFVFVQSGSKISNEDHFLSVEDPLGPLTIVEPRVDGLEYETCDDGERFLILTNADGAVDFKVVAASVDRPGRANWIDVLPHRQGTRVTEVAAFQTFTAVGERSDALTTIRIIDKATGVQHVMHHNEAVYAAEIDTNAEWATTKLRFTFTSLNTPITWIDYDVTTRRPKLVKQLEVLGDFSPSDYVTAREWATADDGTRIPISILCRRDFDPDGTSPCLLYGYGSYEISIDPYFSIPRLNLVDRGVVFAIAHIRGGGEMGRSWYENGKMLRKRNTFTDFIACARHLVDTGWCAPGQLVARGGSAGGLLMGAVANMAPELFNTVVAEVPFVDVVTTMSDETIPLTVTEWEEWGNPRDNADDYQYMKSYSPYDNVAEVDYPALYVEAGLNDPRVQYWEPAKWVAKLRVTKTDDNPLVLKTEMGAGHSGPSGRYSAWEDEARVQAFILDRLGIDY
ncbi:MAG: oligopeptidase [Actinomycetota bacterium]